MAAKIMDILSTASTGLLYNLLKQEVFVVYMTVKPVALTIGINQVKEIAMKTLWTPVAEKKKFITQYLWPSLRIDPVDAALTEELAGCLRHDAVLRMEDLEQPGASHEGRMWFSAQALMHAYYYSTADLKNWGVKLIPRQTLYLDTASLLDGADREHYVQLLEPGSVYSLSYPELLGLMDRYSTVSKAMTRLHLEQQAQQRAHDRFLLSNPIDRATQFRKQHATLLSRLTMDVQAMHIKISRGYYHFLIRNGLV
ncbi:hypothetical protein SAMN05216436_101258 [bacterium A37T11]|nr:hypothetical protein SAMN05216436_101258 [bacterium A37T11]